MPRLGRLLAAGIVALCACPPGSADDALFGDLPRVVDQSVVEGGPNPDDITLTLTNTGSCRLSWTRTLYTVDGAAWLNATPGSGSLNHDQSAQLVVAIDVVGPALRAGTYTGSIVLAGTCGSSGRPALGSPVAISINLTVTPNRAGLTVDETTVGQDVVSLADTWTPLNAAGPSARTSHTGVWTGEELIVWGGLLAPGDYTNSGSLYEPLNDSWRPTPVNNLTPTERTNHTAVWTGDEMLIWGGFTEGGGPTNSGGQYDPVSDTWLITAVSGAPSARHRHSAVWAGGIQAEMIVWGGVTPSGATSTGGRYDPVANAWIGPTPDSGAPAARADHTAVWTGSRLDGPSGGGLMLIWGGFDQTTFEMFGDGAGYDPTNDAWTPIPTGGAPSPRTQHSAIWTGRHMIVWGGVDGSGDELADGGAYDPVRGTWTALSTASAPGARAAHAAVWTGARMIVIGGISATDAALDTGGRYDPIGDTWEATSSAGAPSPRFFPAAVWTGTHMLVWGGESTTDVVGDGGAYF